LRVHARIFLLFKIPKWKSKWYGEKRSISIFKRLKIDGREKYPKQKILINYNLFCLCLPITKMNTSATYNFILKVEVKKSIGSSSIVLKPLESINAIEYNSKVEPSELDTVLNEIMGINFVSNRSTIGGKSLSNIQMETSPYTSDFSSILKRSRENTEKTSMTSDTHDKPPKKIHISKPIPMEKKSKRGRPSKSYVENELLNSNNILSIAKKCSIPKRFLSKNDNTYYKDEFLKPVHSTENEIKGYLTQHTKIAPR
jgi:hypothetical protein